MMSFEYVEWKNVEMILIRIYDAQVSECRNQRHSREAWLNEVLNTSESE